MSTKMEYGNPQEAFESAIAAGTLSATPGLDNYAGNYMYMCTIDGRHQFKNINTRQYLEPLTPGFRVRVLRAVQS